MLCNLAAITDGLLSQFTRCMNVRLWGGGGGRTMYDGPTDGRLSIHTHTRHAKLTAILDVETGAIAFLLGT